jgi:poly-gamma-glutamate synthase PgsB/CapB
MLAPTGLYAVLILLIIYIIFHRIEKLNHQKRLKSIPIRIWVNGSRGKSSVTRLIAAGLRTDGKKVIAKTTGTSARFIINNNIEEPIIRLGMANIREQIRIVKKAVVQNPDALVLECMALRPDLQCTESTQIVKPSAIVITNVRADHLDVMGPTIKDVAKTYISAVPENCKVFTSESNIFDDFSEEIRKKNIKIFVSKPKSISDDIIEKFSYIEHKENIILALDVCRHFGVDKEAALKGMHNTNPDPGALKKHKIDLKGKEITILYAMAANDPDSTYYIWQSIDKNYTEINLLVNCRNDRIDRSFQIADLIKDHLREAEHYILTGSGTEVLARKLYKIIDNKKILNLGGKNPVRVIDEVSNFVSDKSLIFAIGNTVGFGEEMMKQFLKHRSEQC